MTPQPCEGQDTTDREYRGLLRVAGMIARHPDYPGKRVMVEECVEDIVDRSLQGRLTPSHRDELLAILSDDAGSPCDLVAGIRHDSRRGPSGDLHGVAPVPPVEAERRP